MSRRLAVALLATGLLVGCVPGGPATPAQAGRAASPAGATVTMAKSYRFEPAGIRVPVGGTVTWINDDNFSHDVHLLTSDGWHSQVLKPGETTSHSFAQAGEYAYQCSLHPQNMKGTVTVA
jgi:plastocyanin